MSEVKIVLYRSCHDHRNGVWIDGVKLEGVQEVSVFGTATEIPSVIIKLLPKVLTIGLDNPDIEEVTDEPKN